MAEEEEEEFHDETTNPPDWEEIFNSFTGKLRRYYFDLVGYHLQALIKPQNLDYVQKTFKGKVGKLFDLHDERGVKAKICRELELEQLLGRNVSDLSGGELQRFAIAVVAMRESDAFIFDEPSTHLDIKHRHRAARLLRSLCTPISCVIVAEHDLSILGYLPDIIYGFDGVPGAYGVVTCSYPAKDGINAYMDGSLPHRATKPSLDFKFAEVPQGSVESHAGFKYPTFGSCVPGEFELCIMEGEFAYPQIAGFLKPDQLDTKMPAISVLQATKFASNVMELLQVDKLMEKPVKELSLGDLQRVVLCICLGKPADVYLIDEPSAYLDSEQRIVASKVIKRFIHQGKKTAFIVEHGITMATYLADRVIVFEGTPSVDCIANAPQSPLTGMDLFLSKLDITIRLNPDDSKPWINELDRLTKNLLAFNITLSPLLLLSPSLPPSKPPIRIS
ncbi:hypothetical protein C5167_041581 [Papaver somniferum]|nr:hypothetical protein C5167_041581 [Papaver somniferum]